MTDYDWDKLLDVIAKLARLGDLAQLIDVDLEAIMPSIKIECPDLSPSGVEVLVADLAHGSWATRTLATVAPGEAYFSPKLSNVYWDVDPKREFLLVRPLLKYAHEGPEVVASKEPALYAMKNLAKRAATLQTYRTQDVPWSEGRSVRESTIASGQTISSYLLPDWQDVIFYWVIG